MLAEAEPPVWSIVATVAVVLHCVRVHWHLHSCSHIHLYSCNTEDCTQVALAVISMVLFAMLQAYKNREVKQKASGIRTAIRHSRTTPSQARTAQFVASFQRWAQTVMCKCLCTCICGCVTVVLCMHAGLTGALREE